MLKLSVAVLALFVALTPSPSPVLRDGRGVAAGRGEGLTTQSPIPQEYDDLYALLETQLQAAERYLSTHWDGERYSAVFSTELLAANSNQADRVLTEQAWQSILFNLDRIQLLGVRAVKVAVKYPILMPAFPRSAEYLALYKKLGDELRRRNLKFLVQMTPGFKPSPLSALPVEPYYATLTLERYKQEKRQMAEIIIREIHPDYLTVENEPKTAQENTGLPFTVQNFIEIVQYILDGLDRSGVLVGAGAGTWDNLTYIENLARNTLIDYVDMHIYPVNFDFLIDRTIKIAEIARKYNKKLVLGEAWLYKSRDTDLVGPPVAAAPGLFARDVFSFWEPLDVQFVTVIWRLSHYLQIELTSFFWIGSPQSFYRMTHRGESHGEIQTQSFSNRDRSSSYRCFDRWWLGLGPTDLRHG
jgi:hypothetical protein